VPAIGAKWSTWKRYCDAARISMGRGVAALIESEPVRVFGEVVGDRNLALADRAEEQRSNKGGTDRHR
jgi:hypothetical protein